MLNLQWLKKLLGFVGHWAKEDVYLSQNIVLGDNSDLVNIINILKAGGEISLAILDFTLSFIS